MPPVSTISPPTPSGLTPIAPTFPTPAPAPAAASKPNAANEKPWYKREFYVGRAVKPEIVMNFSRQLASFLKAGIPILEALATVGEEMASEKMTEVVAEIRTELQRGGSVG